VRKRLEAWLREMSLFGGAKRRLATSMLASVGAVVDLERKVIVSAGDLDCLCFSLAEQRVPIFKLPLAELKLQKCGKKIFGDDMVIHDPLGHADGRKVQRRDRACRAMSRLGF
jgi:hypothetical protein